MTDGLGREDRPDDGADIDARFDEIVAGLRAEHAESQQRRQEAIRRAREHRREATRPLEGFDDPNPWPPTPRRPEPPAAGSPGGDDARSGSHHADADGTNPPWSEPPPRVSPPPDQPARPQVPSNRRPPHHEPPHHEPPHHESPQPTDAWRSWEESDEEEHFIQPNPPLPAGDLHLWAIVAGLLGGPLLLILSEVFNVLRADWWTPLGILMSVAGVVLLFLRLPKSRDYTDSSGGAQV